MTEIQIIQQVIDGAVKSGMFPNVANVVTVSNAWQSIQNTIRTVYEREKECKGWAEDVAALKARLQVFEKSETPTTDIP